MKFRKKSVVEACQLNERDLQGNKWFWDAVSNYMIITHDFDKFHTGLAWCEIRTPYGTLKAFTGDYIIKGAVGEFYPCKRYVFEKTYEPVEEKEYTLEELGLFADEEEGNEE